MNGQTIAQDMKHKVVCVHCKMEISYPGNTTNLSDHLNRRHSTISLHGEGVAKARGQKRLTDFMQQRREKWNRSSAESQAMDHDIASWIAEDGLPLYLLQKSGFKKFMAKRFPQYDICSRTHLLSLIDKLYEERRGNLLTELSQIPSLAITTDLWTSVANDSYLSLTAHFISLNWELKHVVLGTFPMPEGESHSADTIEAKLKELLESWNVNRKVMCCVTDNAKNIVNACSQLGLPNLSCFGHNINLALKAGTDQHIARVSHLLKKCRKLVGHFKHSATDTSVLRLVREEKQCPSHELIQDVPTRWTSTYDMLVRLLELRRAIDEVLSTHKKKEVRDLAFNPEDWYQAQELRDVSIEKGSSSA